MTSKNASQFEIDVANSQRHIKLSSKFIRHVVLATLRTEKVAAARISIALVDDRTIHEINRQYLQHDYPTDVISFLLDCEGGSNTKVKERKTPRGRGLSIDGEIITSTETAKRNASNFNWTPQDEAVLYLVHGLLHLVGYDDLSPDELAVMRRRERAILKLLNLTPTYKSRGSDRSPQRKPLSGARR